METFYVNDIYNFRCMGMLAEPQLKLYLYHYGRVAVWVIECNFVACEFATIIVPQQRKRLHRREIVL